MKQIVIRLWDDEIAYMKLDERFWCLWNKNYVKLFRYEAHGKLYEITNLVREKYEHRWSQWDFVNIDFDINEYFM